MRSTWHGRVASTVQKVKQALRWQPSNLIDLRIIPKKNCFGSSRNRSPRPDDLDFLVQIEKEDLRGLVSVTRERAKG
jgi:hypothetical protein